ncbi:MAG: hypothetical protein FWH38_03595, partial [Treponema sp.]|nr:hypothetical protein [Treponema sp.]
RLEPNRDYTVAVSANAHDTKGLSMDWEFEGCFSTRADYTRPRVVSVLPVHEGVMEDKRGTFAVEFSFPVSLNSLRGGASFSPSMPGAWHLEEGERLAVFTPLEPWPQGKRFELRLSASMAGENGMGLGRDFISVFSTGAQTEAPRLTGAWRITEGGGREELVRESQDAFNENTGWEKGDGLELAFSALVDLLSVKTALVLDGASPLVLEMPESSGGGETYSGEAVFRFERPPAFESRFSIRLKRGVMDIHGNESGDEYLFRIFANGPNSKPPSLAGIRLPMSPDATAGGSMNLQLRAYGPEALFADLPVESGGYPYNVKTPSWIEFYFDCAPGASIDPFSLMELFRIETSNNVLLFSPLSVWNDGFTVSDPHPEWEQYRRLEIRGMLTNTTNSGLVHFIVNQGLKDTAGNASEKQYRISLVK